MAVKNRTTHYLGISIVSGIRLEVHECGVCGVTFGISEGYMKARREDHDWWNCPSGHEWQFIRESESERLRRERDRALDSRSLRTVAT